jgi:integrase
MANKLTELKCKSLLKSPGKYGDGNGLQLVVGPNQTAKWVLRYTNAGRRHEMGLGSYPQVGLKEAREQAMARSGEVRQGKDPIAVRAANRAVSKVPTFGECAVQYIANQRDGWRNPKHAQQWTNTINQYCKPILNKHVDKVSQDDVLTVLMPIWTEINETASRLRGRIEKVLGYAIAAKFRTDGNPAMYKGSLEYLLPKTKKEPKHQPSLPWSEIPRFWQELRSQQGIAKDALSFLILTVARSGEVRGMTWQEVNFEKAIWTIPGRRMKLGKTHEVPLSDGAMQILRAQKRGQPQDFVFSVRKDKQLSDMTLAAVIKRMNKTKGAENDGYYDPDGRQACPHGFRSSFRIWAAEMSAYPRDVAEFALAHQLPDEVEAAYQRSTLFAQRKRMMDDWANFFRLTGDLIEA